MILFAHTIEHPGAVVIKLRYTAVTQGAMLAAKGATNATRDTKILVVQLSS